MWKWSDLKRLLRKSSPMRDTADLGAIMWPVVYPDDMLPPKDPHVTVVIFTDVNNPDLGYTKEDVIDVIKQSMWNMFLWLRPGEIEWFGAEQNVPVLRVEHDFLMLYRSHVMTLLTARGIPVDMTFPEYKPHVTITPEAALSGIVPKRLLAAPVELWWGNEHIKIDIDSQPVVLLNNG